MTQKKYGPYLKKHPDKVIDPSQCVPVLYFPNLHRQLHSVTSAIIVAYLETFYPAPQDQKTAISGVNPGPISAPVQVDLIRMGQDLQVTRRTLHVCLSVLCSRFPTELERSRAARAGREFLVPAHKRAPVTKPYSVTGATCSVANRYAILRRNIPLLADILNRAQFTLKPPSTPVNPFVENCVDAAPVQTVTQSHENNRLASLLLRASVLSGDRRSGRWERRHLAVKRGIRADLTSS